MNAQPQFPPLAFAADGAVLLHSTATAVTGWDFPAGRQRSACAGRLLGVSASGRFFITETAPAEFSAWECVTGEALPLTPALGADLPTHLRYRAYLQGRAWVMMDVLGQHPPVTARVAKPKGPIENWAFVPHQQWLAYTTFYDDGMFDSASGHYQALGREPAPRVSLKVSRFHSAPPLYFSAEHDWLVTGEQNTFNVYTASTGQLHSQFYVLDGGGDIVAFHPRERFWLAVNADPILSKEADQQGFRLLDVSRPGMYARELRLFRETVPVTALAFHPQGDWVVDLLADGALHVWEVPTGEQRASFKV